MHLKLRITNSKVTAMGPGKADLLDAIIACGSISSAAKHMRMSYRRAWELVDSMNKSFKLPVVITSPGGSHGGGAQVTEFGLQLIKNYRMMVSKANQAASQEINFISAHLNAPD